VTARTLAAIALFSAVSALIGAFLAIAENGGGMPVEYLRGSPFTSYRVQGLILGFVVGGTQLAAGISLMKTRDSALLLAVIAGFGLQTVYFALGGLELLLVTALLGLPPTLVCPWREPGGREKRVPDPSSYLPGRRQSRSGVR
jgi:hypothetical protein